MSPILVPTLSELSIELIRAYGLERAALADADGSDGTAGHPLEIAYSQAVALTSNIIDQIAATPAASLLDLRVKARALDWYHRTVEGQSFGAGPYERLAQQLVAGLLDERIA